MTRMASSYYGEERNGAQRLSGTLGAYFVPMGDTDPDAPVIAAKGVPHPCLCRSYPLVYGGSLTGASFTTLESWKQSSGVVFGAALAKVPVKMQVPKVDSPL